MDDLTQTQREIQLSMRESNLHTMQQIIHEKYKQLENFTCLASPDTVKEHNKILGDIRGSIIELKTILSSHLKSDDKTQELIEKLFERAELNSTRINTLETQRNSFIWFIGIVGAAIGGASGVVMEKIFK